MNFEWDERKRRSNIEKHGIDFQHGIQIFLRTILVLPSKHEAEERFIAIGHLDGRFVAAVYTLRGETIRIISIRAARSHERAAYHTRYDDPGDDG